MDSSNLPNNRYQLLTRIDEIKEIAFFKAKDLEKQQHVIITIINKNIFENSKTKNIYKLKDEINIAKKLSHPNILTIYDIKETKDKILIIQEYINGISLKRILTGMWHKNRLLTSIELQEIFRQICLGLEYAHKTTVHRCLTPASIFLAPDIVKIANFGLFHILLPEKREISGNFPIEYIAPEILEETSLIDRRSDIYSLGVILYVALSGAIPEGRMHSSVRTYIPDDIQPIIAKALNHNLKDRFDNVILFFELLKEKLGNKIYTSIDGAIISHKILQFGMYKETLIKKGGKKEIEGSSSDNVTIESPKLPKTKTYVTFDDETHLSRLTVESLDLEPFEKDEKEELNFKTSIKRSSLKNKQEARIEEEEEEEGTKIKMLIPNKQEEKIEEEEEEGTKIKMLIPNKQEEMIKEEEEKTDIRKVVDIKKDFKKDNIIEYNDLEEVTEEEKTKSTNIFVEKLKIIFNKKFLFRYYIPLFLFIIIILIGLKGIKLRKNYKIESQNDQINEVVPEVKVTTIKNDQPIETKKKEKVLGEDKKIAPNLRRDIPKSLFEAIIKNLNYEEFNKCIKGGEEKISGKMIRIKLVINYDGLLLKVPEIVESTIGNKDVENCISSYIINKWKFSKSETGDSIVLTIPFMFKN